MVKYFSERVSGQPGADMSEVVPIVIPADVTQATMTVFVETQRARRVYDVYSR